MKQKTIREENIGEKGSLVIRARTVIISDDFDNPRQRYSEIYFINVDNKPDSVGLTFDELKVIQQGFLKYKTKYNED